VQTGAGREANLDGMQHAEHTDLSQHRPLLRHPIQAVGEAVADGRLVAVRGENGATPAIMAAAALGVVVPIVATIILLDLVIAHFA
jgi:hypothetical protein